MRSFRSRTVSSRSLLSQPTVLKLSQPVAQTPSLECLWRSNWSIEVVGSDRRWNPALIVGLDRYFIPFQHWELNHRPERKLALV